MKRATKAPPRIRQSPAGGAAPALEKGTCYATTPRGAVLVGTIVHDLPAEAVSFAFQERILLDPIPVLEVHPR